MKDSLESIIAVWKSISPSAANLQVVPTHNPDTSSKNGGDNSKSKNKSQQIPTSHNDLLMSLIQSQQPMHSTANTANGGLAGDKDKVGVRGIITSPLCSA